MYHLDTEKEMNDPRSLSNKADLLFIVNLHFLYC